MPVDHGDAPESLTVERVEEIADHGDVRAGPKRRAARERGEVRRDAEGQHGKDRHPERLGSFHRHPLREDRVGPDGEIAVLLGGSDRHHDAIVAHEVLLEHLPVAVVNPHTHLPGPPDIGR